jgi:hypothetical protein
LHKFRWGSYYFDWYGYGEISLHNY